MVESWPVSMPLRNRDVLPTERKRMAGGADAHDRLSSGDMLPDQFHRIRAGSPPADADEKQIGIAQGLHARKLVGRIRRRDGEGAFDSFWFEFFFGESRQRSFGVVFALSNQKQDLGFVISGGKARRQPQQ